MTYEEKYKELKHFINLYEKSVKSVDMTAFATHEEYFDGQLHVINVFHKKIKELDENQTK